ncbi:hypothetical protein ARSEF4850_008310 [Beauveria asiatica]
MASSTWRPAWEREGREPSWAVGLEAGNAHNPFGGCKFLWGNTPAIDVLQIDRNEGRTYRRDIALLFAASGDLRHVVKTISALQTSVKRHVTIDINDLEFSVVARNAILLLLALKTQASSVGCSESPAPDIADAMIHIWYSAFLPSRILLLLQEVVKPLLDDVCSQIGARAPEKKQGKTWKFSDHCTFRLVLKKSDWIRLRKFLDGPECPDATEVRRAVTLAQSRADYRDRWYFKESTPLMRVAKRRFQEDGLLLPFGHPRTEFNTPNPTLFNDSSWPMDDKADPSSGWPIDDVQAVSLPASGDWYGKLYIYLHNLFQDFLARIRGATVTFRLFNVDAVLLPSYLDRQYTRIEVSNVCDGAYIGIEKTISTFLPLLEPTGINRHATLITLFLNAVKEMAKQEGDTIPKLEHLFSFLPTPQVRRVRWDIDADFTRFWDARDMTSDVEKHFSRYTKLLNFAGISKTTGAVMKDGNTVIEKWPTRPKLGVHEIGAKEEFRRLLGSSFTCIERYVEWRRA